MALRTPIGVRVPFPYKGGVKLTERLPDATEALQKHERYDHQQDPKLVNVW
jgi:hypothetical protein